MRQLRPSLHHSCRISHTLGGFQRCVYGAAELSTWESALHHSRHSRHRRRRLWGLHDLGNGSETSKLWKDRGTEFVAGLCVDGAGSGGVVRHGERRGIESAGTACSQWLQAEDTRFLDTYRYSIKFTNMSWIRKRRRGAGPDHGSCSSLVHASSVGLLVR